MKKPLLSTFKLSISAVVTVLFCGYFPFFPGTIGSIVGTIVSMWLYKRRLLSVWLILFFLALSIFSVFFYITLNRGFFSTKSDPKEVVIDEFVGQLMSIWILQFFFENITPKHFFLNFLFFRFFDIYKPGLVGYIDRNIKNFFGVVFDDIIAGFFSSISTVFLLYIIAIVY